jgi:putative drug exporter of the RND superfamily
MISLAKFSIRRPKLALAGWLVAAGVLIAIGFGVANSMSPSITVISKTESGRAQQLANAQFGPSQLVPILLEGRKQTLNRVGPRIVVALMKRPHTRVLSAWDAGAASTGLRPRPTAAMIVVSVDRPEKDVVKYDQPAIEQLVKRQIGVAAVTPYITGQPSIDRALKDASINDLRRHELIAAAIVFLLLLIGLRAPLAALLVTIKATASMLAAFGEVALLGHFMRLDVIGVAAGSMTGLAIGVGFGLLILDRFHREQLADGRSPKAYADVAAFQLQTTGRAVLIGGSGLVLALALVAIVGPTDLIVSVGTAALTSAAFATGGAVVVMPAALVLFGRHIDALTFPAPRFLQRAWASLVGGGNWVTRHAVYAGFAATVLLAAIAVPALAIKTGPPSVKQLPKSSSARIAFEEVSRVMGPGWPTPYNIVVVANKGAITAPAMLANLDRFQSQIARDPRVQLPVSGPGLINATSLQLAKFGPSLVHSAAVSKQSKKDLLKLINGLGQAGAGSEQLKSGLEAAVTGAGKLNTGAGAAHAGSVALHNGLITASSGSTQIANGLDTALSGAEQLKTGSAQALIGSSQLLRGVTMAQGPASQSLPAISTLSHAATSTSGAAALAQSSAQTTKDELAQVLSALSSIQSTDPTVRSAVATALARLSAAQGAASQTTTATQNAASQAGVAKYLAGAINYQAPGLLAAINMLHDGAGTLESGISQLRDGNAQLAAGIDKLAGGGGQLRGGLGQLTSGAGQLEAGLALLSSGTGQLATGLQPAPAGAGAIANGLGIMQAAVTKARAGIPSTKDLETLMKQSPGMFRSGYFILAAVDGARGSDRNAATFTVNLTRGGTAGQIVVTSRYGSGDPRSEALLRHLVAMSQTFARRHNATVAVGGPGGALTDLTNAATSKIWIDIIVLSVAMTLVLALALRSLVLPIVTVALNLLAVAGAFGVIQLLFGGSAPPLGGPGFIDPVSIISIFTVAFGISVTYSIVLLMRTREAYVAGGNSRQVVAFGLQRTAAAATGSALVMVAAVAPFATTELINVRELSVGVGVVMLLHALIVRPLLLPAAETALGRFGWWPTQGGTPPEPQTRPHRAPPLRRPHMPPRPRRAHIAHH